ncbi:ent-kaur-16-ene synthase chloroplastic-like [Trifolium pratense]|uniref:Ent-kaur-16-ene synthase chloroplastic-like n=1 Tax=Trifolium pratense TaxID=57577 RepID=A0A2K3LK14_TRIPR|nr:ent-kaur-16-ene synthase chloroplastic-like [Trifolium pratense]
MALALSHAKFLQKDHAYHRARYNCSLSNADSRLSWAKNSVLVTVVDDFFDFASSEEEQVNLIQLFEKWDVDVNTVCCSEAVKIIFSALRSTICEIGEKSSKRQGRNVKDNIIKTWSDSLQSMFAEAEWSRTKTIPTIDDYMQTASVSFGFEPIILSTIYLLGPKLSDDVAENKELNYLLKTVNICGRLLNDIQSFKRESEQGKLNAVVLHMIHGNGIVTVEDAIDKIKGVIEENIRELRRLVLQEKGSVVPRDCKDLYWKTMKATYLFYDKNDGYSLNEMFSTVNAVMKDPIILNELLVDSKQSLCVMP